jgi:pyruvate/2-oxoacid:ferredoxin oxidoreductase beta subunit
MDVKVLVLDTQVYSNTGGQASGSTFVAQEAKMAASATRPREGRAAQGARPPLRDAPERVRGADDARAREPLLPRGDGGERLPGPAIVIAYAPCMPEHGIADDMAAHQSKLAVESRRFPLFVHDPRKEGELSERLDLKGNPAVKEDWFVNPRTGEPVDFVAFAKTEGRFRRHFGPEGKPSKALLAGQDDRLANWRLLQELGGVR